MQIKSMVSLWFPAEQLSQKIILVLHGRGDSARGFAWIPEALRCKEVNYLIVDAPDPFEGGFAWYDTPPHQAPGILRSRDLLDNVFQELDAAGYQRQNILLFGFSQGCLMALEWGLRSMPRLGGIVGISGYLNDPEVLVEELSLAAREIPLLVTHGDADEKLPHAVTQQQMQYLQKHGLPLSFQSFHKTHIIDVWRELPLIRTWVRQTLDLDG